MSFRAEAISGRQASRDQDGINVMIIDDSMVFRSLASRWLADAPGIGEVIAHGKPQGALEELETNPPDVVVLDVHMPGSDGFAVLPIILSHHPGLPVILVTATAQGVDALAVRARRAGAAGFLSKPSSTSGADAARDFRRKLVEAVLTCGARSTQAKASAPRTVPPTARGPAPVASAGPVALMPGRPGARLASGMVRTGPQGRGPAPAGSAALSLRPFSSVRPRVLAIGGSTGGPKALMDVAASITDHCGGIPVVIVQHMPDSFTALLAEHLARKTNRECRRPDPGEPVRAGVIYVAPGGRHLVLRRQGGQVVFDFDDGPAINFCKPAVDPMFESVSAIYGNAVLALILTGMGQDGLVGARAVTMAGGTVIAQDEATSVVWGMPGVVARAGLCSGVWPLDQIGPRVSRLLRGERAL
jgi:two-component system, chemotaxis family, protein-glutamate methylesterase/glutaminase